MLMPTIQSMIFGKKAEDMMIMEMLRIKDRQGREMLYGPTNESL